jgi:hypothetical protein
VAVLLQIGLPSRRVAQEVVAHEGLRILTVSGLRAWLRAQRNEPVARWDYLEAAIRPIWISFVTESGASEYDAWPANFLRLHLVDRYGEPLGASINGLFRRVVIDDRVFGEFQTPDGTPLGSAVWPYGSNGPNFAEATLHPGDIVDVAYLGPRSVPTRLE